MFGRPRTRTRASEFYQGKEIPLRNAALFFEPSQEHFVRSHSGDRFSLVAFLHPLLSPSAVPPPDVQANLIKAGFKPGVVDLPSRVPPT